MEKKGILVFSLSAFIFFLVLGDWPTLCIDLSYCPFEFEIGEATLFSRQAYNDYEKATFSFEYGVRDDPGYGLTNNDWDILYGNGGDRLDVNMAVSDRSRIQDLGSIDWPQVSQDKLPQLPPLSKWVPESEHAIAGHMYLVHTVDGGTDFYSLFRVESLIPDDECTISWCTIPIPPSPTQNPAVPIITLWSYQRFDDYDKATFSFEHGVWEDPGYAITNNDWDILYGNGEDLITVNMVTDDRSRICDLGQQDWGSESMNLDALFQATMVNTSGSPTKASVGHMYLVHTRDSDTNLFAMFRVEALVPGHECTISWKIVPWPAPISETGRQRFPK